MKRKRSTSISEAIKIRTRKSNEGMQDLSPRQGNQKINTSFMPRHLSSLSKDKVTINVGGVKFETFRSTVATFPDTRLHWILDENRKLKTNEYDEANDEYFFDRDPTGFYSILNYYRTGSLHLPINLCGPRFEAELEYWGIDESYIERCCWTHYKAFREAQKTLDKLNKADTDRRLSATSVSSYDEDSISQSLGSDDLQSKKKKLWFVLENPSYTNKFGKIFLRVSLLFIAIAIFQIAMESITVMREIRLKNYDKNSMKNLNYMLSITHPKLILIIIDITCCLFFLVELLLRCYACPCFIKFLSSQLNIIDLAATFASIIYLILSLVSRIDFLIISPMVFSLLRIPNILRIFKMTRHLRGLRLLMLTMKASSQELFLLLGMFTMFVIIWGSLGFVAEHIQEKENSQITSIAKGCWWALITMSTVGYGDVVPQSYLGYFIGYMCTLTGVLVLALPIPIIVNNFELYYSQYQAQQCLPHKRSRNMPKAYMRQMEGLESNMITAPISNRRNFIISDSDT